jgi:hypothetical protein
MRLKRSAYQDQQAAGLMTLEELGSKLQELDDVHKLSQAELEALSRRQEHIEELEKDREALLKSMAEIVPDALEGLTPKERNKIYRMLRLEIAPFEEGYEVSGAFCSSGLPSPWARRRKCRYMRTVSILVTPNLHGAIRRGSQASTSRRLEKCRIGVLFGSATPICCVIAKVPISASAG